MYSSYHLCPKCKIRRFFVIHNNERVIFQVKKTGEVEIIKPEHLKPEELDLSEISCLGCSWKGTLNNLK